MCQQIMGRAETGWLCARSLNSQPTAGRLCISLWPQYVIYVAWYSGYLTREDVRLATNPALGLRIRQADIPASPYLYMMSPRWHLVK